MSHRKKCKKPDFMWYDWTFITPILLNKHVCENVLKMLQLFYFCPQGLKIAGVKGALRKLFLFSRLQISPKSLNTLLVFLNIDSLSRESLIKKTFEEQNFKKIVNFLENYEFSINLAPHF